MLKCVLFCALVIACAAHDAGDVILLTDENFVEVIEKYDFVLVKFFAPWCGHCKELAPAYSKAAEDLASLPNVRLAELDATVHQTNAAKYGISGYPTLKLFRKSVDNPTDYNGGRSQTDIVNWMKKKTGPAVQVIETIDAHDKIIEENEIVVFWVGEPQPSEDFEIFKRVASDVDIPFKHVTLSSVAEKYPNEKNKIVVVKKFDDKIVPYKESVTEDQLAKFVKLQEIPFVTIFDDETAHKVFGSDIKRHMIAFMDLDEDYADGYKAVLEEVGRTFYGQAHVVIIDVRNERNAQILSFFAVEKSEVPTFRVVVIDDSVEKFKPESPDFSVDYIKNFIESTIDGSVEPYLQSEDIPDDWNSKPVKIVVGKNFDDVVLQKDKAVFIEFYAPWCGHCKQLAPIWDELGESFANDDTVVIAKMDATANEVKGYKISGFPTIKFFPKGSNDGIDYSGERLLTSLKKFVDTNGKPEDEKEPASDVKEEL